MLILALFLIIIISFHVQVECQQQQQQQQFECPIGWHNYGLSCYNVERNVTNYKKAKDKCGNYKLNRTNSPKLGYLTIIESDGEMEFVLSLLNKENITISYIGASNLKNRSRFVWERIFNDTDVDTSLFCQDTKQSNTSFACGVIQKGSRIVTVTPTPDFQSVFLNETKLQKNYCLNISNCFQALNFICEVNCTRQEHCKAWIEDVNNKATGNEIKTPCQTGAHKCENNSTCISNTSDSYKCECEPGFNGTYCEQDERPCLPHKNRCRNNSTCTQYGWKYNCTCESGFTGFHCEINIDDCENSTCLNGGQCIDLINGYECDCITYFYGDFCQFKHSELVIKEQVSRSFSVLAISVIILTYGFFVSLDTLRYVFHIEPDSLSKERQLIRKKKLIKKIMRDMKDKRKRKRICKIAKETAKNSKDTFVLMLEKTFHISYDQDLYFIDDNISLSNPNYTIFINQPYNNNNNDEIKEENEEDHGVAVLDVTVKE